MMNRLLPLTLLLFPLQAAMASEVPRAAAVCEAQQQRCTDVCNLDKVLWLYEGEAYGNCVQQCEADAVSCLAADLDVDRFEVILPRSAYGERDASEKPSLEEYEIEAGE